MAEGFTVAVSLILHCRRKGPKHDVPSRLARGLEEQEVFWRKWHHITGSILDWPWLSTVLNQSAAWVSDSGCMEVSSCLHQLLGACFEMKKIHSIFFGHSPSSWMSTHGQGADGTAWRCEGGAIRLEFFCNTRLWDMWTVLVGFLACRWLCNANEAPFVEL